MSYDHWKTRSPDDELLGPEPQPELAERLDAVRHRHLNLTADPDSKNTNRPGMSVWPAIDEDMPPAVVTLQLDAAWGVPTRYVDMTPGEARTLARHLLEIANLVDRETGAVS